VNSSEPSTALIGALKLPGEFKRLLTDRWPVPHANPPVSSAFRCILLTVTWLRPFVLAIASLQLLPSNLFDFGLFNCGWTIWLFVLAIAGLRLGILYLFPGQLTFGTSVCALDSSVRSLLTGSLFLVNVLHSVLSLAIEGLDAWFRLSPVSSTETVLPLQRLTGCGGHSARYNTN